MAFTNSNIKKNVNRPNRGTSSQQKLWTTNILEGVCSTATAEGRLIEETSSGGGMINNGLLGIHSGGLI